jgi:hypothetical protein
MRGILSWWRMAAVLLLLIAASWLLYAVWRSPRRVDLSTYGAFAVPVMALMAGWIGWVVRAKQSSGDRASADQDLSRLTDSLAMAVKTQWEHAANERGLLPEPIPISWGRPSLPLTGPVAAAIGSRRFTPLPGFTSLRESQLVTGQIDDLHTLYAGLRSGRLVIAGSPGAGKSSAAVLLVLAALRHRNKVRVADRAEVPVPVLLTLQDWDPRRQPLKDWLIDRLQQGYPLLAGRSGAINAGQLIDAGKLTIILDGLDEIAEDLRPVALQALNQASFRIMVLSRTAELASAASQGGVLQAAAAVELRAVDAPAAASYLEHIQRDPPPTGWHDLICRIRADTASPLTEALNNPLALTLIRDTYQSGDDARELLEFCDATQQRVSSAQVPEEITGHLLDRVLPAAYATRPGQSPPTYDLQTAHKTLAKIAARMNQDGIRDLQWWQIPRWTSSIRQAVLGGFLIWLVIGGIAFTGVFALGLAVSAGILWVLLEGIVYAAIVGIFPAFTVGVATWVGTHRSNRAPARMGKINHPKLQRIFVRKNFGFGLRAGLIFGPVIGFAVGIAGLFVDNVVVALEVGSISIIVGFLIFGIAFMLAFSIAEAFVDLDSTSVPSPIISWRNDRRYSIVIGLIVGVVTGALITLLVSIGDGIAFTPAAGFGLGVQYGVIFGLITWLVAGIGVSRCWPTALAAIQLSRRWHTPSRLLKFLDDAHKRNVLRTVGPVYQFRHARLQDRLAATVPENRYTFQTERPKTHI